MSRCSRMKSDTRRLLSFLRAAKSSECHSLPGGAGGGIPGESVRGETRAAQFIREPAACLPGDAGQS